ncbi:putative outer membrane protein [Thermosipho africanus H17ap60334]|jgi:outer membrane lipoprotein-sorting protein|uniref:outer membrane lipoprotein-sorting protein n=1 Tax=Thermosipho TaxID=2420 RepID=UPI00028DE85C|nr:MULTISPECIES: outer membrane lipoprotein-sorting protein [Thermosipho]EKF49752.1 putative outer membrane protein [Thermosipho africanus H17ap60334]MBZ4650042.1 putative outer membrane protein [Thermosipho sp. (in: thermotogales)]RDI91421.1 putative outer membrane protein [Thermosipho africanus Ob7]
MRKVWAVVSILVFSIFAFSLTGQQVLDMVKDNYQNVKDEKAVFTLKMTDEEGTVKEKQFVIYLYKKSEDDVYAIIRFEKPVSDKRLTLLVKGADNIYLYMPAFRTTKRISGAAKNDRFAGSDFTYKDIELVYKVSDKNYKAELVKEDEKYYYLHITHNDAELDFKELNMKIDKELKIPVYIEFFNWQGEKYKTITFEKIENIQGYNVPTKILANNIKENTKTEIILNDVEFDIGIPESFFSPMTISKPILKF